MDKIRPLLIQVHQVANGYIVTQVERNVYDHSETWVAKTPTKLAELIEKLAVAQICGEALQTLEEKERGKRSKQDTQPGSSNASEKYRSQGSGGNLDPRRPSHDGIDHGGRQPERGPRIDTGF